MSPLYLLLKDSLHLKHHLTLVIVIIPFLNTNSGKIWHIVALSPGLCRSRPADEGKGKKISPITTRERTASSSHFLHYSASSNGGLLVLSLDHLVMLPVP